MTLGKTPWRELKLEEIALWDAAPRRFVLGLLASLVLLCVTLYWLMPQYEVLQQRRQLNHQLQTQFAQQVNPWALAQKSQGASGQGVQALSKDACLTRRWQRCTRRQFGGNQRACVAASGWRLCGFGSLVGGFERERACVEHVTN
jgi:hypothetical protein